MIVVLKEPYKREPFIEDLNNLLADKFGSNTGVKFVTKKYVQEDADFINKDSEGVKQLPDWKRPVSAADLEQNFFWYRTGEFHFKTSGGPTSDEARDAVAICKWILKTRGHYIERGLSANYGKRILRQYLDEIFSEAGYDLGRLWSSR